MKTPVILLLTNDSTLEESIAEALHETGGYSHLTQNATDALQLACTIGQDVDLAVIDCEHGPYGLTLAGAIRTHRKDFPLIVVTPDGGKLIEALAYANGATVCLSKPVSGKQLVDAMEQCLGAEDKMAIVA